MGPERMVDEWVFAMRMTDAGRYVAHCFRDGVLLESEPCGSAMAALGACWRLVESHDRQRITLELPAVVLP